ncbi:MAG: SDR family oxidoreductase [Actinomycetota bacterium]
MAKTVVITGASTGIGEACALRMDELGWRVFAGVRRDEDGEALRVKASERLTAIKLDVADAAQIEAAAKLVADAIGREGLDGLVNNAGIAVPGPLEFVPLDDLRRQLEINVVGVVATTQAFLPMIRAGRGRIVHMGSIGGSFAVPFAGPYSASKFALEAITDAMRVELAPWDIRVALVKPAAVATPIWSKGQATAREMMERMPKAAAELYGKAIAQVRKAAEHEAKIGAPPAKVATCVEHALTAPRPRTRYYVGPQVRVRAFLARFVPDRMRDSLIVRQLRLPRSP